MRIGSVRLGHLLCSAVALCGALVLGEAQAQTLRVGMSGSDMATLDPHRAVATLDSAIVNWMFNGLVRIKPGQINPELIEPDLASSWETTPDHLTWTFKLRQGVECQGGYGPLTANDVVFSLKRAMNKETSAFFADYSSVKSVEATAPDSVTITLSEPVPSLLGLLIPYHGGNIVCQKAVEALGDGFARSPFGTGPFEFAEYQPQRYVRLKANEKYFRGAPQIKEIIYNYIASDSSRDLAFQSGEIDLVNGRVNEQWLTRTKEIPGTTVAVLGPYELHSLLPNMSQKPFDDIRVRQALAHAIDVESLVKFRGPSIARAPKSVIPSGFLGYAEVPLYKYDPAEAKRLLAEAGHPNGITIKSIQTSLAGMLTTAEVYQAQLRKSGINLEFVMVDHPTFHAQIRQDLSQLVYYGAARFPIADTYLTQFFDSASIPGKPTAVTNFSHCDVADAEIRSARTEADLEKQKALWATAQKKIAEAVCSIPMFEMGQLWAWNEKLAFAYPIVGSLGLSPPLDETTKLAN